MDLKLSQKKKSIFSGSISYIYPEGKRASPFAGCYTLPFPENQCSYKERNAGLAMSYVS